MAQLNQVLGAILRDIAQARAVSDVYSRDLSRYYQDDSVLRLFPVPRTDIKEAVIDLKFAITNVEIDTERRVSKDVDTARLLEIHSATIVSAVLDTLLSIIKANDQKGELLQKFQENTTDDFCEELRAEYIRYLEDKAKTFLDKSGNLDVAFALKEWPPNFWEVLMDLEERRMQIFADFFKDWLNDIDKALAPILDTLYEDIQIVNDTSQDYKIDVEVAAEKLQQVPDSAISTLHFSALLRNYHWTQVEKRGTQSIRRLIQE